MATKTGYLKNAIAKADGYYSAKGEKLKSIKLSKAEMDAWNGVKKTKKKEVVPEPVKVEEVVSVVVWEELEEAPAPSEE